MKQKILLPALLLFAAALLCACGQQSYGPAPDLDGHWTQVNPPDNFYQTAIVSGDRIEVFWHITQDNSYYLYWSGSFDPPPDGKEPYTWESKINLARAETDPHCRREDTMTFIYKNGQIIFVQIQGRVHMGVALEKDAEPRKANTPQPAV